MKNYDTIETAEDEVAARIDALETKINYQRDEAKRLHADAEDADDLADRLTTIRDGYKRLTGLGNIRTGGTNLYINTPQVTAEEIAKHIREHGGGQGGAGAMAQ